MVSICLGLNVLTSWEACQWTCHISVLSYAGLILDLRPANEKRCYFVTKRLSLAGCKPAWMESALIDLGLETGSNLLPHWTIYLLITEVCGIHLRVIWQEINKISITKRSYTFKIATTFPRGHRVNVVTWDWHSLTHCGWVTPYGNTNLGQH